MAALVSKLDIVRNNLGLRTMSTVIQDRIRSKLQTTFEPCHLEIVNESYMHNVPKGSETHFKVLVVSDKFTNTRLIQRHRLVNECLQVELDSGVHALSIVAKTKEQWDAMEQKNLEQSPACRGGFGK